MNNTVKIKTLPIFDEDIISIKRDKEDEFFYSKISIALKNKYDKEVEKLLNKYDINYFLFSMFAKYELFSDTAKLEKRVGYNIKHIVLKFANTFKDKLGRLSVDEINKNISYLKENFDYEDKSLGLYKLYLGMYDQINFTFNLMYGTSLSGFYHSNHLEKKKIQRIALNNKTEYLFRKTSVLAHCLIDYKTFVNGVFDIFYKILSNYDVLFERFEQIGVPVSSFDLETIDKCNYLIALSCVEALKKNVNERTNEESDENLDDLNKKGYRYLAYVYDFFYNNKCYISSDEMWIAINYLKNEFDSLLKYYPGFKPFELKTDKGKVDYSTFKQSMNDYLDNLIDEIKAESIDKESIINVIDEIQKQIDDKSLSVEEYKRKKHQLDKLKMVFEEMKPKAIQKGLGAFDKFNVYYYSNGNVAIDKIDYGARLFIMPITTYKYIVDNNITSLRAIGRLNGVKAFKHDDRTDWLSNAKNYLLYSNSYVDEEDIKISEQMTSWEFNYSESDLSKIENMIESIKNNTNYSELEKEKKVSCIEEEIKKTQEDKIRKYKRAKDIDNELKESNPDYEVIQNSMASEERKLDSICGYDKSYEEIYEAEKEIKKTPKRSVTFTKVVKDRTMDCNMMFHCEWCGKEEPLEFKSFMLEAHHLIPISEGGPDTIYNGICLCADCHKIVHNVPELFTPKVKAGMLNKIEKHIREENPELLEEFIEYKNHYFGTYNEILSAKRSQLREELEKNNVDNLDDELDARMQEYEASLDNEYMNNPGRFDENTTIEWNYKTNDL